MKRALSVLVVVAVAAACDDVPTLRFVDDDAGDAASDGGHGGPSDGASGEGASGDAAPPEAGSDDGGDHPRRDGGGPRDGGAHEGGGGDILPPSPTCAAVESRVATCDDCPGNPVLCTGNGQNECVADVAACASRSP